MYHQPQLYDDGSQGSVLAHFEKCTLISELAGITADTSASLTTNSTSGKAASDNSQL